ncbi:MAG: hypothetical protein AUJ52_06930 [Elusimicrobia bacterium CG1_02_63_36]|nr:MAG: hypothetical protein AUJ52_06930 [Elusimicrobia bacterium CG1_02_63_36]PIP82413.1 MAG: hypothetical protein COR54_14930 [Elusimicrobia bacterium CG22_combo_CG10-13_8_21_14_all_63_91]PJA17596.1 MAG: hypothetical protein COX66_03890 [Elusimicrobia bacterium CG_4_10_14_0_2_um_filter_63_34]PJB26561.1 MAG: hypothetical protein CO113_02850 [Elusimicrobia bacterium CG_4_9_14_3_um_filter_62_55]
MPPETDNLKLEEIFQADQKDREKVYESQDAVDALRKADKARRQNVSMMMELGEIKTKNDLYHAAVIFQHGDEPQDFLTAHRLATLAAIHGHRTSRWLLAASLDRYLMSLNQGQVYGTQFEFNPTEKRYQLKLPVLEHTLLSFEKEMLGIPSVNDRLNQLNRQIKS